MKTVFWLKGDRGVICFKKVIDNGHDIRCLVLQFQPDKEWYAEAKQLAASLKIPVLEPLEPDDADFLIQLRSYDADLFILAGYGKILNPSIIAIPKIMCINLHGGKLPKYRGSSPMNWAIINGEPSFGISIIKVDSGVDTGDILMEKELAISVDDTIAILHAKANQAFARLLVDTLKQIYENTYILKKQDDSKAAYYPLRFPDDGLVLWDMFTAKQIHNRIRALSIPYPCAYTFYKGRKIRLMASIMRNSDFFGEPGRVYLKKGGKLLVCAKDRCLWITKAVFDDSNEPLYDSINRYERLATVMGSVEIVQQNVQNIR